MHPHAPGPALLYIPCPSPTRHVHMHPRHGHVWSFCIDTHTRCINITAPPTGGTIYPPPSSAFAQTHHPKMNGIQPPPPPPPHPLSVSPPAPFLYLGQPSSQSHPPPIPVLGRRPGGQGRGQRWLATMMLLRAAGPDGLGFRFRVYAMNAMMYDASSSCRVLIARNAPVGAQFFLTGVRPV